jgi:hypothetical protein
MGGYDGRNFLSSMESLQLQTTSSSSSKFYIKLFEKDNRDIIFKIDELATIIQDVHEMKVFYTLVNNSYRMGIVHKDNRTRYISTSLEKVSSSTTCYDSIAIFKQLLRKAREDGIINYHDFDILDRKAEVAHTAEAPFVKDIWNSIEHLEARVDVLEHRVDILDARVANLESRVDKLEQVTANLVDALKMLQKGIRRKQKINVAMGMMGAVLNAVSFGVAGSAAQGVMGTVINSIVDFGDISHIETIVETFGDATVRDAFQAGIDAVANKAEDEVYKAANKGYAKLRVPSVDEFLAAAQKDNPLFAIVVTAQFISQEYDDTVQDTPQAKPSAATAPATEGTAAVSTSSRLDALEEAVGIEKTSAAIKKRVEAVEENWFGEIQKGALKDRISQLENDIL